MEQTKFHALIVDHDLDSRMRLKQATTAVPLFGMVQQCSTFFEATSTFCRFDRLDVIFISEEFAESEVATFIEKTKQDKVAQDAAFVRLVRQKKDDGSAIAAQMVAGVDGFLFQPYSVNQLVEITRLSAKVKKDRSLARSKLALNLLLGDFARQLDMVSTMRQMGCEPGKAKEKLSEISTSICGVSKTATDIYESIATNFFENQTPPPAVPKVKKYGGASSRVRKRMGDKIQAAFSKD